MENRERNILEAATQVFLRYGVKRASMGDIAAEAGVARQTLYNIYANKDDILRGSIAMYGEDAMAAIEAELPERRSVKDQVALVLREMTLKPYVFLHSSPNAQDLIEGYNEAGRNEMEANYTAFQAILTRILAVQATNLEAKGLSADLLAEIIRRAATAFKYQASDEAHLSELIDGLLAVVSSVAE